MDAFLAAMAWGYGNVGYGPWRVAQALEDPQAAVKVLQVATALHEEGALAAYSLMATECRLNRIGPAFGTKFLYFADSGCHAHRALILDRLVADWLNAHTTPPVNPVPWSLSTYEAYLDRMHCWAAALGVKPDALELAMFSDMAEARGNQWAGPGPTMSSRTPK